MSLSQGSTPYVNATDAPGGSVVQDGSVHLEGCNCEEGLRLGRAIGRPAIEQAGDR